MIILLLSTPRSGSHYYSEILRKSYPNSTVMHEVLSRAAQGIYLQQIDHIELSSKQLEHNSYYEDLVDGKLVRVYRERPDPNTFFNELVNKAANSNQTYILHEHASLIPKHWIEQLINISDQSMYLTRNRREQLASRIIAGHTGVYIIRPQYMLCHGDQSRREQYLCKRFESPIATKELVEQLLHIYNSTDQAMANLKVATVSYESLQDTNSDVKKLFASSYARLCEQDQQLIENVLLSCDL